MSSLEDKLPFDDITSSLSTIEKYITTKLVWRVILAPSSLIFTFTLSSLPTLISLFSIC